MQSFRDVSIRAKLLMLLVGLVSLALVISSGVSALSNIKRVKSAMAEHHTVLADVLAANSTAALSLELPSSAEEILSSLELEPAVLFACTYDVHGKVFATYHAKGSPEFSAPVVRANGASFSADDHLEVFSRITLEKQAIGTIYLRVSMERLNSQINYQMTVAVVVLVVALAIALLLGWQLQKVITQPIYQMVQATQTVSQQADYSLRVPKQANDELGLLCDGLNAMLTQIEKRDAELEQHRFHLEELVQERTRELEAKTKELARSFAERNQRVRLAVEAAPTGLIMIDRTGTILLANSHLEEIFGYDSDELIGQSVEILVPEQNRTQHPAFREAFFHAPRARSMGTGDLFGVRKDGTQFPVEIGLSPIHSDAEVVVVAGVLDITERHRANEERRRNTAELARSNAELELFASVASHDLQEPLRMVASYMELLEQRYGDKLDEKAKRWINFAVGGVVRMKQLINDLLEFSRVGTRGKPFVRTNCNSVFQQVRQNLQQAIRESEAQVECGPLPTVLADETQITQVLQNLIANAIKFHKTKPAVVQVAAERADNGWRFSVRDNGIGIDAQFAERIFVIFQRLHTREEYPGTGIGLALCRKVIERHGGRIWVESQPGEGATFFFTIPDRKEDANVQQDARETS